MKKLVSFFTSVAGIVAIGLPVMTGIAASQNRAQEQDRAQSQDRDRQNRQEEPRFQEKDREAARNWYNGHRDHPPEGFRTSDRLDRDAEAHLRVGVVIDNDFRRRVHPVPEDLLATLPPPPAGYRYVVIGGHIMLVDHEWRVHDIININL
jgi:Ni/Co efflux regulator RcnB